MTGWPSFVGTFAQWVTAGTTTTIAAILGYIYIWKGRIAVDARRALNEDEANIRDHYAGEVRQLRARLDSQSRRHYRVMSVVNGRAKKAEADSLRQHEECVRERDELRDNGRRLKDIVAGLIRIIAQAQTSKAILLDSGASAYVRDAAERIDLLYSAPPPLPEEDPA